MRIHSAFVVICLLFMVIFSGTLRAETLENGQAAYESKNWIEAIRILRPLAEDGDDRALVLLGNMYNDGNGVQQNHQMALEHYKQALTSNNDNAMLAIAAMYTEGLGVDKDFPTAFTWFNRAADAGNPAAQFMMGSLYLNGHAELPDLQPDPVKAYGWYRITALQTQMPEVANVGREFARRVIPRLSPDQILRGEKIAEDFYANRPTPTNTENDQNTIQDNGDTAP